MNIFQRVFQKILEIFFLYTLNFVYKLKFKKIFYQNTKIYNDKIKFSLIIPIYNTNPNHLSKCIESVINQTYQNWEICISDDASSSQITLNILKKYSNNKKIKVVFNKTNEHISSNSDKAVKLSSGEYLCLLDHDDYLWPNALAEVANILKDKSNLKFIYTDQDKIIDNIHFEPFLKPDLDLNLIKSVNYFNHFTVINKSTFDKLKGFKKGTEGAQDWDLYLRMLKITKPEEIYHLNKILYSWRISPTSTAGNITKSYAYINQEKVLKTQFPNDKIYKTPYLGIWQFNNQKFPLPYQFHLKSLISLL